MEVRGATLIGAPRSAGQPGPADRILNRITIRMSDSGPFSTVARVGFQVLAAQF
jgi:hypothetical protein